MNDKNEAAANVARLIIHPASRDPRADDELSVAEAAREANCHQQTIYRRVSDGTLPAVRVGPKSIRIKRSDLAKLRHPITSEGGSIADESEPPMDPIREAALRIVATAPRLTGEHLDKIVALLGYPRADL